MIFNVKNSLFVSIRSSCWSWRVQDATWMDFRRTFHLILIIIIIIIIVFVLEDEASAFEHIKFNYRFVMGFKKAPLELKRISPLLFIYMFWRDVNFLSNFLFYFSYLYDRKNELSYSIQIINRKRNGNKFSDTFPSSFLMFISWDSIGDCLSQLWVWKNRRHKNIFSPFYI